MISIIKETEDPVLFRFISDRNLLTQYDTLEVSIAVALKEGLQGISHDLLKDLNAVATKYLSDAPGQYRQCPIYINNSPHIPPNHEDVFDMMQSTVQYVFDNWTSAAPIHLGSYVLWRVNWIHPFVEGNGRTARAACYYVLCVATGMWLPGRDIIPQQIRADRNPYYEALREADKSYKADGTVNLAKMENYLSSLLTKQLTGL